MADDISATDPATGTSESSDLPDVMDRLSTQTTNLTTGANGFARAMSAAFTRAASDGKGLDSVMQSLALRLSNMAVTAAFRPLTSAISGGLGNLFGGTLGAGTVGAGDDKLLAAMNTVQPFATGGVIGAPTYFPMGSGLGLAGEAGPEAIMPLARGADGRLGVATAGGAGTSNVTVHVNTPDVSSFRRSESYVTGLIARAVARGQRSL